MRVHRPRMAVIGTHARDTPIGGYSDVPGHVVSVLEGMQEAGKGRFAVAYSEGVRLTQSRCWSCDEVKLVPASVNRKLIAAAVQTARKADVIVMVLGGNEQTSREAWADNHLGDRESLDLVGQQNDLARAIFDLGKPTFRSLEYEEYKAGRRAMPDDLRPQMEMVRQVLESFSIPIYGVEGFEADDVIGTLARLAEEHGHAVTIVSGDLDCLQLVTESVEALVPPSRFPDPGPGTSLRAPARERASRAPAREPGARGPGAGAREAACQAARGRTAQPARGRTAQAA